MTEWMWGTLAILVFTMAALAVIEVLHRRRMDKIWKDHQIAIDGIWECHEKEMDRLWAKYREAIK